ncbi:MAG TPA: hypothetical protein VK590_16500, partial [Saprospiraceae bacterium]|nr:hypothetical protein [Saprospiraceae bacterium]
MKITNTFLIKTIILIQFVFLINLVSYNPLLSQTTITKQITASSDDAEEEGSQGTYNAKGAVFTTGIYLELISDNQEPLGLGNQTVGLRFNSIDIPNHAEITNAYLVFHCLPPDENNLNSALAKLTIKGQASDNPFTFVASSTGNFNISDLKARPQTQASVSWNPDQWLEGNDYNSPDLKSIIQELINRKGWVSNNSMAFIISGAGSRTTESFDYLGNNPPKLVISYNKNFTVNHDDKHIDEVGSELSMLDNPVITSQPLGSTICKGGSFSPDVVATGGNSALNYQWQYSSNGSTNWNNVINGTPSNATYTSNTSPTLFTVTGNLLSGSYYYRCVITSSGAGSISINSNTAILKVLPDPTVIVQPLSATICVGSTYAPYLIASGGTPSLTYQWQFSPTGFSGWSNVVNGSPTNSSFVGATSPSSFSVSGNLAVGAYYFRCVVSSVGGGCNSTYTINAVLTVGESPVIILQPTSASLCKAVSYNPIIKALGGTPTYQWQYSEDGINAWEYVKNGIPANSKYTGAT